jgi:hypothetical protein
MSGRRRRLAPQLIGQSIACDELVGVEQQEPQQRALSTRPNRQLPAIIVEDFERAKQTKVQRSCDRTTRISTRKDVAPMVLAVRITAQLIVELPAGRKLLLH